ncbi:MAG: nitrophenyl compound nitroreductase subunit ArsF family protein [Desulfobacterota bacterium]|nr:nitrophenyl compound nitroreductase subunit ArsF family protein [Thermodesulfobacteriota bacterium]
MISYKYRTSIFHLVVYFVSLVVVQITYASDAAPHQMPSENGIIAYYFYGNFRCPTCRTIEQLSRQSIENHFQKQLKDGSLIFLPVNIDAPENRHFIDDYKLVTRSLVITKIQGGKQVSWKNLDKVWQLVRNEEKFDQYIKTEIENYLK